MWRYNSSILTAVIFLSLFLNGCENENATEEIQPATLHSIPGTDFNRVTLTKDAAKRVDIQTLPLSEVSYQGKNMKVIPYSAVIYGPNGQVWVYTVVDDLTFVRAPIQIENIEENNVFLIQGPKMGTKIVTVGASELYGAEYLGNIEP